MIYPTMKDLTKGKYNRYELAIATAKGARMITNEYVRQRAEAEAAAGAAKDGEKPAVTVVVDKKLKDEKAVKISIDRIAEGEFVICEEAEETAAPDEEAESAEETAEVATEDAE